MQGTMESAVSLVTVYGVKALGSLVVTLTLFRLNSPSANCDGVCMHDVVRVIEQQEFVFGFQDQHFTGALLWRSGAARKSKCDCGYCAEDDQDCEETFHVTTLP